MTGLWTKLLRVSCTLVLMPVVLWSAALTPVAAAPAPQHFTVLAGATTDSVVEAFGYFPGTLTIDAGDSVTWVINGDEPHTISFGTPPFPPMSPQALAPAGGKTYAGSGFVSSGLLFPGQRYTLTFTAPGTYPYSCLIHLPAMTGMLAVQPAGTPYPPGELTYQAAADPALGAALRGGVQALNSQTLTTTPNANGTTTYFLDAGVGDGKSFGVLDYGVNNLVIHAGDTVVWTEEDPSEAHTITFLATPGQQVPEAQQPIPAGGSVYDGHGYVNSGFLLLGQSYHLTFTTPGVYPYRCLLHDDFGMDMLGTVTVLPAGQALTAASPASLDGAASFGGAAGGTLPENSGGAFAYFALSSPGSAPVTLTLTYGPYAAGAAHSVGVNVYQDGTLLASAHGEATGLGDPVTSNVPTVTVTPLASGGPLLLQVFNYSPATVTYTLRQVLTYQP
ncbi:MAG: plastocyanin/azurin family copper-binding protein [Chloroflexi bacterium]|nr:plastocyanin/azurin family copper-binding protein [Chloroflexota bacterium]